MASQMPRRPDDAEPPPQPRLRFSLRTLLWTVTACAIASAVLGWIGPEWRLAFLLGLPHIALWGVPLIWLAVRSLRKHTTAGPVIRSIFSVMWIELTYVAVFDGLAIAIDVVRSRDPSIMPGEWVRTVIVFEVTLPFVLLFLAAVTVVVAAVVSVVARFVLMPWGSRPTALASLVGGGVGSTLGPLLADYSVAGPYPMGSSMFLILPIAVGMIFPPLLMEWANRLGPLVPGGSRGSGRSALGRLRRKSDPDE